MAFGSMGPGNAAASGFAAGPRSVPFSRTTTTTDSTFASTTVTFPRSTVPIVIHLASSVLALVQVQGNGKEMYAATVTANQPRDLYLPGFPETTTIVIQSKLPAKGSVAGAVDYR